MGGTWTTAWSAAPDLPPVTDNRAVLLMRRHRFVIDSWGWEVPLGSINSGEDLCWGRLEVEEETGWQPTRLLRPLIYTQPTPGLMTSQHYIFRAESAATMLANPRTGSSPNVLAGYRWARSRALVDNRDVVAASTLVALLYLLATEGT